MRSGIIFDQVVAQRAFTSLEANLKLPTCRLGAQLTGSLTLSEFPRCKDFRTKTFRARNHPFFKDKDNLKKLKIGKEIKSRKRKQPGDGTFSWFEDTDNLQNLSWFNDTRNVQVRRSFEVTITVSIGYTSEG